MTPETHAHITSLLRSAGCVFAEEEARLLMAEAGNAAELAGMVERRAGGLPLEQVLGWAEFDGQRIAVGTGVFVPRRRTEFLIRQAASLTRSGVVVVDLGCGSGALGVALAARVGRVELHASDIEPAAVECARQNVASIGGQVYAGDLFEALPPALRGHIDTLLANMPYVPTAAMGFLPAEARLYEPAVALDGGADGLDLLRRVAVEAPNWLAPGGHLFVETSERQAEGATGIVRDSGLAARIVRSRKFGATVIIGASLPNR